MRWNRIKSLVYFSVRVGLIEKLICHQITNMITPDKKLITKLEHVTSYQKSIIYIYYSADN